MSHFQIKGAKIERMNKSLHVLCSESRYSLIFLTPKHHFYSILHLIYVGINKVD